MVWILTGVLAVFVGRIIFIEIVHGRQSNRVLAKTDQQIADLTKNVMNTYRAKFGRDPTAPFIKVVPDKDVKP